MSVAASYVMGKCRSGVFVSVLYDAKESMEFQYNEGGLHGNAVLWYFCKIRHFTLVEEPKVFKNNVWEIYSVPPKLCMFFVFKIRYVPSYTMFPALTRHLFHFFIFLPFHVNRGFQAYLPAKHLFCEILKHVNE